MPLESALASFASWLRFKCVDRRTEIDIEKSEVQEMGDFCALFIHFML